MRDPLSFLGGFVAGVLVMYYLDTQSGGRRRALVRDRMVGAGHDLADAAQGQARRTWDRAKGLAATGSFDRMTRREPESDQQLHDRIRARLGRATGHPKSVQVEVEQGCVSLSGHVLRKDLDGLLSEVRDMAGVKELRNALQVHDSPEGIPELQGSDEPPGRRRRATDEALR